MNEIKGCKCEVWAGIDVGLRNLAVAFIEVDRTLMGCDRLKAARILELQHIDLGSKDLRTCIQTLLHKYKPLLLKLAKTNRVIIEQQLGRHNPKMFAFSHVLETAILCTDYHKEKSSPPDINFLNSKQKFKIFEWWGYKPIIQIDRKMTRSQKYTATKKNALAIGEFIINETCICEPAQIIWDTVRKKQRYDLSDAMSLVFTIDCS